MFTKTNYYKKNTQANPQNSKWDILNFVQRCFEKGVLILPTAVNCDQIMGKGSTILYHGRDKKLPWLELLNLSLLCSHVFPYWEPSIKGNTFNFFFGLIWFHSLGSSRESKQRQGLLFSQDSQIFKFKQLLVVTRSENNVFNKLSETTCV